MTARQALIEAIYADPAADLPRLAYADWLDDHGDDWDRLRADHLRASVELDRHAHPHPLHRPLLDRYFAAGRAVEAALPAEFPYKPRRDFNAIRCLDRGLLTGVLVPAHRLDAVVGPLVARGEPVLDVCLMLDERAAYFLARDLARRRRLLASPFLRHVGTVNSGRGSDPADLAAVLAAPGLTAVRRVNVDAELERVRALVESPAAARVRVVNVNAYAGPYRPCPADPADRARFTRLLADRPALAGLRELGLNDLVTAAAELRPLVESPHLSPELRLNLNGSYRPPPRLRQAVLLRFPRAGGYQLS